MDESDTSNVTEFTKTTDASSGTQAAWWTEAHTEELSSYLWRYTAPVIFFLGVFGNITTLVVLRWKRSASDTTTTYFVQLVAAADLCFLVAGMFPQWLMFRNFADPMESSQIGCKVYKFFMYSSGDVAVWYMAAFTVERFVAVYYPIQRSRVCTLSRIKLTALFLIVLAVVKNVHTFWTRGAEWRLVANTTNVASPSDNDINNSSEFLAKENGWYLTSENGDTYELVSNCGYTSEPFRYFHLHVRVWVVFVFANLVPLIILIICNSAVVWKLLNLRKGKGSVRPNSQVSNSADAAAQQITIMCLVISICFFIFIMPSMILLVGKPYFKTTEAATFKYDIAQAINNQLLYINHSINFYLYFITCYSFRQQTISLFMCRNPPQKPKSTASGAPVQLTAYRSSAHPGNEQSKKLLSTASSIGTPV